MKKKFDKRRLLPALTLAALALAVLAPFGWFAARDAALDGRRLLSAKDADMLGEAGQQNALARRLYLDRSKAAAMCQSLGVVPSQRIKTMSKGTKEKVQLVLVMARKASLYLLDEPIAGVDPAARDYILNTILTNYNEAGCVVISTHLISDIEKVLDEAIFLKEGQVVLHDNVDAIREREGKSVDTLFREVFRTAGMEGGAF